MANFQLYVPSNRVNTSEGWRLNYELRQITYPDGADTGTFHITLERSDGVELKSKNLVIPRSYRELSDALFCGTDWFDGVSERDITATLRVSFEGVTREKTIYAARVEPKLVSVTIAPCQPEGFPQDMAEYYVAGISGVRVTASVDLYTESNNCLSVRYEGRIIRKTFAGKTGTVVLDTPPLTGNVDLEIWLTDRSQRNSASSQERVDGVLPYVPPTMELKGLWRCDEDGAYQENGSYYRIEVQALAFTDLPGNRIQKLTACLNGQSVPDDIDNGEVNILGGSIDPRFPNTVTVVFQDRVTGEQRREFRLAGLLRDFVLKRYGDTSNLGIGCTPTQQSGCSIQLPTGGKLIIGGQDVIAALVARIEALENGG